MRPSPRALCQGIDAKPHALCLETAATGAFRQGRQCIGVAHVFGATKAPSYVNIAPD
jgi:hypothetical protein